MAGLYLHIPFCKRRCIYCDFYSTTQSDKKGQYISALCKELRERKDYADNEIIETIYWGGGTPSQLAYEDFSKLFSTIAEVYNVSTDAEITLEANPDDLTEEYLESISNLPFNRLSMGIQTFDEERLKLLNRRHTATQAIEVFERCRRFGIHNISIDLIYGLPGESLQDWDYDLQQALALHPEHISAYHLIYEEGTPLWDMKQKHTVEEADEDLSLNLFKHLIHTLKSNGYEHYEISNFSLPGKNSRHNSSYWNGKKYIGCGPSAHSYDGVSRQWNISSLDRYIGGVNSGEKIYEVEELDLNTRYNDFVITTIRTSHGMSLLRLKTEFGKKLYDYCMRMVRPHVKQGTMQIVGDTLKLTESGIFVSDNIMGDMMMVD